MKRIVIVMAAVAAAAAAQTTTTLVFTTVDAVKMEYANRMFVTGVLEGATEPVTRQIYSSTPEHLQNCEKLALLAIAKPGQYLLQIDYAYSTNACTLRRVAP